MLVCRKGESLSITIFWRMLMAKPRNTKKDVKKKATKSLKEKKKAKRDKKHKEK
jgi:hypothetical protein